MSSFTYTTGVPNPPDNPSVDVPNMQTNTNSINGIMAVDHVGFNSTGPAESGGGQHLQVTFNGNNVPGSFPVNQGVLFTNLVNSLPQLFYWAGSMAQSQNQYSTGTSGSTFLFGGIILKWVTGSIAAGSINPSGNPVSFPQAFPNNCYAVFPVSQDGGTTTTANTFVYGRLVDKTQVNLLFTLRTSLNAPSSGSITYSFLAIGN